MTTHTCEICKFSSDYLHSYKKHLESQRHLRNEMRIAKRPEHKCSLCGYSTHLKFDYTKHMKNKHQAPTTEPKILARLKRLRSCMYKIRHYDLPDLKAKLTEHTDEMLKKLAELKEKKAESNEKETSEESDISSSSEEEEMKNETVLKE